MRNSTLIKENVAEEVSKLKEQPGQDILVGGSRTLVHTLMDHDLVDEYRMLVFPIVLGAGKRLFEDTKEASVLTLVDSKTLDSGGPILTYRPVR